MILQRYVLPSATRLSRITNTKRHGSPLCIRLFRHLLVVCAEREPNVPANNDDIFDGTRSLFLLLYRL